MKKELELRGLRVVVFRVVGDPNRINPSSSETVDSHLSRSVSLRSPVSYVFHFQINLTYIAASSPCPELTPVPLSSDNRSQLTIRNSIYTYITRSIIPPIASTPRRKFNRKSDPVQPIHERAASRYAETNLARILLFIEIIIAIFASTLV